MSTDNIGFYEAWTKIIFQLSSNFIKYAPYLFLWFALSYSYETQDFFISSSYETQEFFSFIQLRNTRRKVEEARSAMESNKSQGKVIEFIMGLKKSGTLPGVYGRLVSSYINLTITIT